MKNVSPLVGPVIVPPNSLIPRIMISDDDSAIRSQLVQFYKRSGYTAVSVGSGEEALALLEHKSIDFCITDINLPGMNGTELVANIKEHFPDVPVITDHWIFRHRYRDQCAEERSLRFHN